MIEKLKKQVRHSFLFTHKDVLVEIVFFINSENKNPIYNFYIHIERDKVDDSIWRYVTNVNVCSCYGKKYLNYFELNEKIIMPGGITFYGKILNDFNEIFVVKIGCDYNHLWDHESGFVDMDEVEPNLNKIEKIRIDSIRCIDLFFEVMSD